MKQSKPWSPPPSLRCNGAGGIGPTLSSVIRDTARDLAAKLLRLVVPLGAIVYGMSFWFSMRDLPPEAATYPRTLVVVLIGLSAMLLVRDLARRLLLDPPVPPPQDGAEQKEATVSGMVGGTPGRVGVRGVSTLALLSAYAIGLPVVGFASITPPFLGVMFLLLGLRRILIVVTLSVSISLVVLVLAELMNVPLP